MQGGNNPTHANMIPIVAGIVGGVIGLCFLVMIVIFIKGVTTNCPSDKPFKHINFGRVVCSEQAPVNINVRR